MCLQGLRAVMAACPQLHAFSVSSDQQAAGLASVGDAFVAELAQRCPRITALELSDTSVGVAGAAGGAGLCAEPPDRSSSQPVQASWHPGNACRQPALLAAA